MQVKCSTYGSKQPRGYDAKGGDSGGEQIAEPCMKYMRKRALIGFTSLLLNLMLTVSLTSQIPLGRFMRRDFHEQVRPCRCRDRGLCVIARDLDWSERSLHHSAKLIDTAWAARQMSYTEPMVSRKTSRRVLVLEIVRAEILRAEVTDKGR